MNYNGTALSVQQPWAWVVVRGLKEIENRSWSTNYRGRLFIHAGKTVVPHFDILVEEIVNMLDRQHTNKQLIGEFLDWGFAAGSLSKTPGPELGFGAMVGEVDLVGWITRSDSLWHEDGLIGWQLEKAKAYKEPIPYRGKQKLFTVEFEMPKENDGDDH